MGEILLVTRHYAPEPTGSAPVIQAMAEWLARQGDEVEVLTVRPSYPTRQITAGYTQGEKDDAVEAGVHVRRLPTQPVKGRSILARVLPELGFCWALLLQRLSGRTVRRAFVISLCPSIFSVAGAIPLVRKGGRHIAVVHDIPSGLGEALGGPAVRALMAILRHIEACTLNRVDHVVVLSDAMARHIRALGVTTPIDVLPPHLDIDQIHVTLRPRDAPPTLMYSGNLGRKQGLGQLLDLAAKLNTRAPDVSLIIRGQGSEADDLRARIADEGLVNVALEPLVPKDQLGASLAQADIHLVPQVAEGGDFAVPSKAFAIMAAGRPFIATAAKGSSLDQQAAATGAFACVPPDDPEAFCAVVVQLLADPARRQAMGSAGRAYVEREVATDVVMRRFRQILVS